MCGREGGRGFALIKCLSNGCLLLSLPLDLSLSFPPLLIAVEKRKRGANSIHSLDWCCCCWNDPHHQTTQKDEPLHFSSIWQQHFFSLIIVSAARPLFLLQNHISLYSLLLYLVLFDQTLPFLRLSMIRMEDREREGGCVHYHSNATTR